MDVVKKCGFEVLPQPPHSLALAPSDYQLYTELKQHLLGKRYSDDNNLIDSVQARSEGQNSGCCGSGSDLQGDFVESKY